MRKNRFRKLRPQCQAHRAAVNEVVSKYKHKIAVCGRAVPGVRPPALLVVYQCQRCKHDVLASPTSVNIVRGGGIVICHECADAVAAEIEGPFQVVLTPGAADDLNAHRDTIRYRRECEGKGPPS
jgi:transcription elongation factor Elf1